MLHHVPSATTNSRNAMSSTPHSYIRLTWTGFFNKLFLLPLYPFNSRPYFFYLGPKELKSGAPGIEQTVFESKYRIILLQILLKSKGVMLMVVVVFVIAVFAHRYILNLLGWKRTPLKIWTILPSEYEGNGHNFWTTCQGKMILHVNVRRLARQM